MQESERALARQDLESGLQHMGVSLSQEQQTLLLDYLALLLKWNKAYNLTAVRDAREMVSRHLLDSLSVLPFVTAGSSADASVLDVGTGPGLPGIPLAIALPDQAFILLDSNGKKTRFLFQVQMTLKLDNIRVVQQRIENFHCEPLPDLIVSRAFSSLRQFVESTTDLWQHNANTRLLAMKGEYPRQELAYLPSGWTVQQAERIDVPGSNAERHIIALEQKKPK